MEFLWNGPPYQGSQSYRRKRKTSEIFFSDEQDEFDALPEEYKDHLFWRAFIHKAGLGPNPGLYKGPTVGASADEDLEPTEDVERSAPEGGS